MFHPIEKTGNSNRETGHFDSSLNHVLHSLLDVICSYQFIYFESIIIYKYCNKKLIFMVFYSE